MSHPYGLTRAARLILPIVAAAVMAATGVAAQGGGFKVAFYNIRSGEGVQGLAGHARPFAVTDNCDPSHGPVDAWGIGMVQKELVRVVRDDQAVLALGLAEAWKCATPKNVREVLGWKQDAGARNGVSLLARYGFAGEPEWLQLETSNNRNPKDTMWVVRGAVCRDARCSASIDVYAAHWSGTGPDGQQTYDTQAQQTIEFMAKSRGPHVLVGDLNVFEGNSDVCHQKPNNSSLEYLRKAGYVDAWVALRGNAEGFTGMLNRNGCGQPMGYAWKRIDYAWSKGLTPRAIDRFGMVPPGDAAPSDHYGIVAQY